MVLEAFEMGIKYIQRHLDGIPGIAVGQHFEMKDGILMAGESDEAYLALFFGEVGRFDAAAGGEDHFRILVVDDFMELPQIDHIGTQAT